MNNKEQWSRLKGFFSLKPLERRAVILSLPQAIGEEDFSTLDEGLSLSNANRMSENVIGTFELPFSLVPNFIIDGKPAVVPMVTEEPSIVAACAKVAKLVGENGGFSTRIDRAVIKGQIQIYGLRDVDRARADFEKHRDEFFAFGQKLCARMQERGGGLLSLKLRVLPSPHIGPMLVIEPTFDVVDAMGANMVNTAVEALSHHLISFFDGHLGLRILSNLCDQRLAFAQCSIAVKSLASKNNLEESLFLAEKLIAAHAFAEADIYRACTHNKGILNGIDAVAIATGNDFRAIEAGAHAFASQSGQYQPLTRLSLDKDKGILNAELTLPLAIGVVGGITGIHPGVKFSHKLLGDFSKTAKGLSAVMVSVGLAQCLAALIALTQGGIQRGHMKLHHRKSE